MKRKLIIFATIISLLVASEVTHCGATQPSWYQRWYQAAKTRVRQALGLEQKSRAVVVAEEEKRLKDAGLYNQWVARKFDPEKPITGQFLKENPEFIIVFLPFAPIIIAGSLVEIIGSAFIKAVLTQSEKSKKLFGDELKGFLIRYVVNTNDYYPTLSAKIHALLKKDDFLSLAAQTKNWGVFDEVCNELIKELQDKRNWYKNGLEKDLIGYKEMLVKYPHQAKNLSLKNIEESLILQIAFLKTSTFYKGALVVTLQSILDAYNKSNEEQQKIDEKWLQKDSFESFIKAIVKERDDLEKAIDRALTKYRNELYKLASLDTEESLKGQLSYLDNQLNTVLENRQKEDPEKSACMALRNAIALQLYIYSNKLTVNQQEKVNAAWAQSHSWSEEAKKERLKESMLTTEEEESRKQRAEQRKVKYNELKEKYKIG